MTKSTMGLHVATGNRNGYGEVAPYARGVLSFEHGAIDPANGEIGEFTTTIYRDVNAWALDPTAEDSHYDADKPPNLEKMTEAEARANARVQWPRWKAINLAAPADAYQILNEVGGSWNPGDGDDVLERVTNEAKAAIAFEDEIMLLNEEDGHPFTLLVGSMAGDNPHWDSGIWQELWTPHIWKAWEMGHWYGRHAYTGVNSSVDVMINEQGLPADANVNRPFVEIDWFLENMGACGPIVLSECGYVTYPGEPKYTTQMVKYDEYIRESGYDKWIGFQCLFTYGEWWNANIEDSSPELHAWMSNNVPTKWEPAFEPGNTTPPTEPTPVSFPNGCFSEPWKTLENGNQEPGQWGLAWNQAGDMLPNGEKATRTPECVHKEDWQLPPNEQPGGEDALILCGDKTYKMFGDYGKWGAMLTTAIQGLTPGAWYYVGGNFQVHYEEACNELDDILIDFSAGDDNIQLNTVDLQNRQWIYSELMCQAGDDGLILVDIHAYTKYTNRRTLFVDNFTVELVEETPPIEPPTEKHKVVIVKIPQEGMLHDWISSAEWAYDNYKRTQTASTDDMMTMLDAGNAESYAVIIDPWLPSQQEAIERIAEAGYSWVRLELGTPPNSEVVIDVPHMTQVGNDISNECGAACAAMVINGMTANRPTVDDVARGYQNPPNSYMTFTQIGYALKGYDMTGTYERPFMANEIEDSIFISLPVIALVHYSAMPQRFSTFSGSHFIVIYGMGDGYFLYRDPLQVEGTRLEITHDELTAAMAQVVNDGNMAYQGMMCEADYVPPVDPDPPTGEQYDLSKYLAGDGRIYIVKNSAGSQERFQTQFGQGSWWYQTKNSNAESMYLAGGYIGRDWDTSPGGGRYYRQQQSGTNGAPWMPQYMRVGESFTVSLHVQFYNSDDCTESEANSGNVTDTRTFVEHLDSWTSQYGITVQDVIVLRWDNGGEYYYYARGFGLVAWGREHDDPNTPMSSAISEITEGQEPNKMDVPNCLIW